MNIQIACLGLSAALMGAASTAGACPAGLPATQTGDDASFYAEQLAFQPLNATHFPDSLGADLPEWAAEPGGVSTSNLNLPYRRLVNASILLRNVNRSSGGTWFDWAKDRINDLDPASDCGSSGQVRATNWGLEHITITRASLMADTPVERAGTIVHEACHSNLSCGHRLDGSCGAGGASCDTKWETHSAQTQQIVFLLDARNQRLEALPSTPHWNIVLARINQKLNDQFNEHPGFNVYDDGSFGSAYARNTWTQSGDCCESTSFGSLGGPFTAITGFGIGVDDSDVDRLNIRRRVLGEDGKWGAPGAFGAVGRDTSLAIDRQVALPTDFVTTGFLGRVDFQLVHRLGVRARRILANGDLGPETLFEDSLIPSSTPEVQFRSPNPHTAVNGIGLRASGGHLVGFGFNERKLPWFKPYVGGQGGTRLSARLPDDQMPIGITVKAARTSSGDAIGYFGLIGATTENVEAGRHRPATVLNTSYFDTSAQRFFQRGMRSFNSYLTSQKPNGAQEFFCPASTRLRGIMTVADDTFVRRIVGLQCRRHSDGAGQYVPVNVGTGYGDFQQDFCTTDNNPALVGFFSRSGWLLDGLSFRCGNSLTPPLNGPQVVGSGGAIPATPSQTLVRTLTVDGEGSIETLRATVFISHPSRGHLRVTLRSPSGTDHILHDRSGGSTDHVILQDVPVTTFDREAYAGVWRLFVNDNVVGDTGHLIVWAVEIN